MHLGCALALAVRVGSSHNVSVVKNASRGSKDVFLLPTTCLLPKFTAKKGHRLRHKYAQVSQLGDKEVSVIAYFTPNKKIAARETELRRRTQSRGGRWRAFLSSTRHGVLGRRFFGRSLRHGFSKSQSI